MAASSTQTSSDHSIRLGIVGCGEVTRAKHLPAIQTVSEFSVVGAADIDRQRCNQVAEQFGINYTCSSIEDLLNVQGLDAVAVCTPPSTHADIAIAALRAGKHLWIDKPMALSEDECVRIIREASLAGTVAMTGFHMRFHRLVVAARAAIRRGEIGRIQSVRVTWHSPRSDLDIAPWKNRRDSGGGALVEIAVHHFDLLRFILDSEIAEIFAFSQDDVRDDENAVICARMSDGLLVSGEFSERSPHEIQIIICGAAGTLELDCLRFDGLTLRSIRQVPGAPSMRLLNAWRFARSVPAGLNIMRRGGDYRISYLNAWNTFAQSIRGHYQPGATLDDGLRATMAVCAALRSREQRSAIAIPPPPLVEHGFGKAGPPYTSGGTASPTFSIVVPTYNRCAQARELLKALVAQRFPMDQSEVILINDGGDDNLESLVCPFRDQLQIHVLHQQNKGCSAARQFGIDAARGKFLAFTDDDCRPGPDWLSGLYAALVSHPGCAVVGPTTNALHKDLRAETTQLVVNWLTLVDADEDGHVRYGPTCNVAFPAEDFRLIGGLDKTWRIAGGEDRDLCARWLESGRRIFFDPRAQVMHYHSLTLAGMLRQHFNYGRGARRFRRQREDSDRVYRQYHKLGNYLQLLILPLRNYQGVVAAQIALFLGLAEVATTCGLVADMLARRRQAPMANNTVRPSPAQGFPK